MKLERMPLRIVTATSLFDGHDVSINIFRRLLQNSGAEVIHLGHNRSAQEIVKAAIEEYVQAIAVSSYQGGHIEFFKYLVDLLKEHGASDIKVFGGGGGVILPNEKLELEKYGVERIYTPFDGQKLGLQGIIDDLIKRCDFVREGVKFSLSDLVGFMPKKVENLNFKFASLLTAIENNDLPEDVFNEAHKFINENSSQSVVIGVTGTGGAGKSTLVDELLSRFLRFFRDKNIIVLSIDPTKRKTGGALLGDRIRINSASDSRVFVRSFATRKAETLFSKTIKNAIKFSKLAGFDLIFVETSGIGQLECNIVDLVDFSIYVMTSEFGSSLQLEKINMLDYADYIVINKFDKWASQDAMRDVRNYYRANRASSVHTDEELPIFGTVASRFNDLGVNALFLKLVNRLGWKIDTKLPYSVQSKSVSIIPQKRRNYLSEVANTVRNYKTHTSNQVDILKNLELYKNVRNLKIEEIDKKIENLHSKLDPDSEELVKTFDALVDKYQKDNLSYEVRDKKISLPLFETSLSGKKIPKIAVPNFDSKHDKYRFMREESFPGYFPYTAGVFPLKRKWEEPRRQFAGIGTPERTNKRFHYLTKNEPFKRLSTAFDSLTLYGEDPDERPDIFGKIGESGVSVCTLDDMKKLYEGFDLSSPDTSVSMTINGPAPIMLAFFFNTAIDQAIKKAEKSETLDEYKINSVKESVLSCVRGTIQADILKEDQAQNTCIFSLDFALSLMADVQKFFSKNNVKNFYSISVSGYHIAEAGANAITQLAFTLANGFTYLEYFISKEIPIDNFASNLSFFFSNGMEPEYSVIGRVARRIWAIAVRDLYEGNERSQKLKYHIQTSGRSLHSQEMTFNDIRTTLQALMAVFDNCNSLHTNSYDEAITTPTEEAVRQAIAIQLILQKEFGMAINENPYQGSFLINYLTELVEEAVLEEFDNISSRGGVFGAMESQYLRKKIQQESMHYETKKNSGEYPIIGVNTFLKKESTDTTAVFETMKLSRASIEEKRTQIQNLNAFKEMHKNEAPRALEELKNVILKGGNSFEQLMETVKVASLGQITSALYEVGGKYRRNI